MGKFLSKYNKLFKEIYLHFLLIKNEIYKKNCRNFAKK